MGLLILRRLAFMLLTLVGMSLFIFLVTHVVPQDPARLVAGDYATRATLEKVRRDLGLDRPLWEQYYLYMRALVRGDLGRSFMSNKPVLREILTFLPATIELSLASVVFSLVLGIGLGVLSAVHCGRVIDHLSRVISVAGAAMPIFWYGLMLQLVFYRRLGWLPVGGRLGPGVPAPPSITGFYTVDALLAGHWTTAWNAVVHLILPGLSLSFLTVAILARITRSSMLESLSQDYVRTARSKGLPERRVVMVHALRNASLPIVTVFGLRLGAVFAGAVLTEAVFAWPGIGTYAYKAIEFSDFPVIIGFAVIASMLYAMVNLFTDLVSFALDPRLKR
ncbi:MAG: ABC transporter permease [Armatimonadota bacterium]|nr:ABC transporter permease [Armatimonadota bacterium]MDR7484703.1 ABC transporter permease [Armatimonadota bacterium]MDR7531818.1 ABC transporter permease [Armatimonadota bacterium]MDR7534837.1 ABC transporter permease [Armatimonadota bacterium]